MHLFYLDIYIDEISRYADFYKDSFKDIIVGMS